MQIKDGLKYLETIMRKRIADSYAAKNCSVIAADENESAIPSEFVLLAQARADDIIENSGEIYERVKNLSPDEAQAYFDNMLKEASREVIDVLTNQPEKK